MGYGDIVPISARARLIDALVVTPVRLVVWLIFLGTAYELLVQRTLEDFRMLRLQRTLSGHVIVCGFGSTGASAWPSPHARRPCAGYFRQNAGVNSTSTLKISRRPRSIASEQIHV